ncbi:MAG TPA: acyl carrier protein [Stellaceae bacterium]|nr:acyl carrier protein [Stellaceae bacterium]
MTESEIYAALNDIFRDIFADDSIVLAADSSAKTVKGWDSFAHIKIVVAVESRFGIKMRTKEIETMANVGDLVRLVETKTAH